MLEASSNLPSLEARPRLRDDVQLALDLGRFEDTSNMEYALL